MPEASILGDKAQCTSDGHGCPGCKHPVVGPAIAGSPTVYVNGKPLLRKGDPGLHASCCGPNTWVVKEGSGIVYANGLPVARKDDPTQHCGGLGHLITGSSNVFVGGPSSAWCSVSDVAKQLGALLWLVLSALQGKKIAVPPGVDLDANIELARSKRTLGIHGGVPTAYAPFWFKSMVETDGPWDYKQQGKQYEDFGNFNYGATGKGLGIPEGVLLRQAGKYQQKMKTSKPEWGDPGNGFWGGTPPYGDDPDDQAMIKEGFKYYDEYMEKKRKEENKFPVPLIIL